jgi:hypothetical protein
MKRISLPAALAAAGIALAMAATAQAVDPNRGQFNGGNVNPHQGNSPFPQNQQGVPTTPTSIPGQQFFNSLGNFNDPFFTPEIYSPTFPSTIPQIPGGPQTSTGWNLPPRGPPCWSCIWPIAWSSSSRRRSGRSSRPPRGHGPVETA